MNILEVINILERKLKDHVCLCSLRESCDCICHDVRDMISLLQNETMARPEDYFRSVVIDKPSSGASPNEHHTENKN